jgi:RimK-like ATP-grasp domain
MIIVLSYDYYEQGTEYVIDWLIHLKANFLKITFNDIYENKGDFLLDVIQKKLFYKAKDITGSVTVIFYRRLYESFSLKSAENFVFKDQIQSEVTDELFSLIQFLFFVFKDKKWLPHPTNINVNKLVVLALARECGLKVPETQILNSRDQLNSFLKFCNYRIVTKPIAKSGYYVQNETTFFANVNALTKSEIDGLPSYFFPSLFQQKIEKEFEIRVFFLDGTFYSFGLLTESNSSYVDIKLHNYENTTQWMIINLPKKIKYLIRKLMKELNLNTGSIDLVKTAQNEYFFLEVNPVGQFSHMSHYGNFNLEKIIAEWLIKNDI